MPSPNVLLFRCWNSDYLSIDEVHKWLLNHKKMINVTSAGQNSLVHIYFWLSGNIYRQVYKNIENNISQFILLAYCHPKNSGLLIKLASLCYYNELVFVVLFWQLSIVLNFCRQFWHIWVYQSQRGLVLSVNQSYLCSVMHSQLIQ